MKLASLKHGRDGKLVVVSKDITRYSSAEHSAPTMQYALDNWTEVAPQLEALYRDVEHWTVPCGRFHEHDAASPLPRAYQWADGSAYINHVELVRQVQYGLQAFQRQFGRRGNLPTLHARGQAEQGTTVGQFGKAETAIAIGIDADLAREMSRTRGERIRRKRHPPAFPSWPRPRHRSSA